MKKTTYKKYSRDDQRILATWAADCALRVLPFFECAYPKDERPRKAIKACRKWVRTGIFRMDIIREASLSAHAAARKAKKNAAACFAARAAGHAVGTAHVAQHAYGASLYALKAIAAAYPNKAEIQMVKEYNWQARRLSKKLREEIMSRIIIQKNNHRIPVKIKKGMGF